MATVVAVVLLVLLSGLPAPTCCAAEHQQTPAGVPSSAAGRDSGRLLPPTIPLPLLLGPPRYRAPQLSPDGKLLAFIQPATGGANTIFVAAIAASSSSSSSSGTSSSRSVSLLSAPQARHGVPGAVRGSSAAPPSSHAAGAERAAAGSGAPLCTPVQVTFANGVHEYFWASDSSAILFLVESAAAGASSENFQLWRVPLSTKQQQQQQQQKTRSSIHGVGSSACSTRITPGTAVNLTPRPGDKVQNVWLSPAVPLTALLALNRRRPAVFDAYDADLDTQTLTLHTANPGDVTAWVPDARLNIAGAVVSRPDGSRALKVRDASTSDGCSSRGLRRAPPPQSSSRAAMPLRSRSGSNVSCWRVIYNWPLGEEGRVWGANRDGSRFFVSSSAGRDTAQLLEISAADGAVTRRLAAHTASDVSNVQLDPTTQQPTAVAFELHSPELHWTDASDAADWAALQAWRPHADSVLLPVSRSHDARALVFAASRGDGNAAFYLWRRGAWPPALLFQEQPALAAYTLARTHAAIIPARDGLRLPGYLTLPVLPARVPAQLPPAMLLGGGSTSNNSQRSKQHQQQQPPLSLRLPLVLLVHGGPWQRASWGFSAGVVQWLANRGYAVLAVNFRGSTGLGKLHASAGDGQWGVGAMQHDLTDAVRWAVSAGIADPSRVCIMGASYGGYAVFAGLAFTPELYACGIAFSGVSNLAAFVEAMPPWWAPLKQRWLARVGNVTGDAALNRALSPVFHAARVRAPLLIGQGGADMRVARAEADAMHAALKASGKGGLLTYRLYPEEGHGLVQLRNRLDFYGRAEQLLAAVLGSGRGVSSGSSGGGTERPTAPRLTAAAVADVENAAGRRRARL